MVYALSLIYEDSVFVLLKIKKIQYCFANKYKIANDKKPLGTIITFVSLFLCFYYSEGV